MRLIDADALMELSQEWVLHARWRLSMYDAIRDQVDYMMWDRILDERMAFVEDIKNAPTVDPKNWINGDGIMWE